MVTAPPRTIESEPRILYAADVVGLQDLTYKTVPGYRPLKLDLYVPKNVTVLKPAVVFIHGGGFEIGEPRSEFTYANWTQVLARLAARGYVVASITYRFSGEARFPAAVQDAKDAIRWLRKNAAIYGIDANKIIVWGPSAGGYLAAMVGTTCHAKALDADSAYPEVSSCVAAAVDWFGPTDFTILGSGGASKKFLGCEPSARTGEVSSAVNKLALCTKESLDAVNPISYVAADSPAFLVMHGESDPLVPVESSQRLVRALRAKNVPVELHTYPNLGHGFTGATDSQLNEILEATFKFFDEQKSK
jgi:acetyl esterase/lipase